MIPLGKWVLPVGQDLSETLRTSALAGATGRDGLVRFAGASFAQLSASYNTLAGSGPDLFWIRSILNRRPLRNALNSRQRDD